MLQKIKEIDMYTYSFWPNFHNLELAFTNYLIQKTKWAISQNRLRTTTDSSM